MGSTTSASGGPTVGEKSTPTPLDEPVGMERDVIRDRARGLDAPPTPQRGRVTSVDFGFQSPTAREQQYQRCQSCDDPVRLSDPHARAVVRLKDALGPEYKTPVFCSRACWLAWATHSPKHHE